MSSWNDDDYEDEADAEHDAIQAGGTRLSYRSTRLKRDHVHDRKERGVQMIGKFASILTNRNVRASLTVGSGIPAPAWSTSNTIGFDEDKLKDLGTIDGLLSFKGLSVHEVSHILFSPRSGSDIAQWVRDEGKNKAFQALEDQRIETLLVGRFGASVVPWLTSAVANYLLDNPQGIPSAYALLRGRRYLPVEVRRVVRQSYENQQDLAELSRIIDEYRLLIFPVDTERAKVLIEEFDALLSNLSQQPPQSCGQKDPDTFESSGDSRPLAPREQRNARDRAKNRRGEQDDKPQPKQPQDRKEPSKSKDKSNDKSKDSGSDKEQQSGGSSKDKSEEQESQDGDGSENGQDDGENQDESQQGGGEGGDADSDDDGSEGDGQGGDGDEEDDSEGDGEGQGGNSNGSSDSDQPSDSVGSGAAEQRPADEEAPSQQEVQDALQDAIQAAKDQLSDSLARDMRELNGELDLMSNDAAEPSKADYNLSPLDDVTVRAARAFARELESVKADNEPGWDRVTPSGRINPSRYLRGAELDEAFDRWTPGRDDATDIEAVIAIDVSASMSTGQRAKHSSDAMWGIKRALDRVGAHCTVITYNGGAPEMLYRPDEKAGSQVKKVQPRGGTDPRLAIKYATKRLAESSRAIKILFSVTDGEWGRTEEVDKQVKTLRQAGVLTALAMIEERDLKLADITPHNHEIVAQIKSSADLFILGRHLVRVATERNLSRP